MVALGFKKLSMFPSFLFFASLSCFSCLTLQTFFLRWCFSRLVSLIVPQFTWLSQSGQTAYPSALRIGGIVILIILLILAFLPGICNTYCRLLIRVHLVNKTVCWYNVGKENVNVLG